MSTTNCYCVGIYWKDSDPENQLPRFLKEGIWENGYDEKFFGKVNAVPVGSRIAAKTAYTRKEEGETISVLEIHALGTVTKNHYDGQTLEVQWDKGFKPFTLDGKGAYRSTINRINSPENISLIFGGDAGKSSSALNFDEKDLQYNFPLNLILYGPPGTGKTYRTIAKAVSIIDNLKEEAILKRYETRELLHDRFDELIDDGQIRFVTFHQSTSYEDFIEGIKPVLTDEENEGQLSYEIQDGLFKQICTSAKYECYKRIKDRESGNKNLSRTEFFNLAYDEVISIFEEKFDKGELVYIKTKSDSEIEVIKISSKKNLIVQHKGGARTYIVSRKRLLKLFLHFKNIDEIKNVQKEFRAVMGGANTSAYWATLSLIDRVYKRVQNEESKSEAIVTQDYEEIKDAIEHFTLTKDALENASPEKYVLIIDEINRGNVAQVFGELITLLEEDKREGNVEGLKLTLPYSKDSFSVPPNLYVIGTMNTADRSVEAIDTALRRRFSFELVPPDSDNVPEMLESIELRKVFDKINSRISYLLDADHQLGHSYFMGLDNPDILKGVFKNKILPLLKEYFYNDYSKIRMILGEGFVKRMDSTARPKFAIEDDFIADKFTYQFLPIDNKFNLAGALALTLKDA